MPLTAKGNKIMKSMVEQYGKNRGKRIFYASRNKGTIAGVDMVDDDGDLIIKHLSDDDNERMAACHHRMDDLKRRMDAVEERFARERIDKGHWIARTTIPAGEKIERKVKQGRG
jgi:hypothetical protein